MTNTVWKFTIPVNDTHEVEIAGGLVRWLHASTISDRVIDLWAEVTPSDSKTRHRVYMRGTGHQMTGNEGAHIATVIDGPFVWHLFADAEGEQHAFF